MPARHHFVEDHAQRPGIVGFLGRAAGEDLGLEGGQDAAVRPAQIRLHRRQGGRQPAGRRTDVPVAVPAATRHHHARHPAFAQPRVDAHVGRPEVPVIARRWRSLASERLLVSPHSPAGPDGTAPNPPALLKLRRVSPSCSADYPLTGAPRPPSERAHNLVVNDDGHVEANPSERASDLPLVVLVEPHVRVAALILDRQPVLLPG